MEAHVKPSTATTGSRMISMLKYLLKRRVKRPMTGEQHAANGAAGQGHAAGAVAIEQEADEQRSDVESWRGVGVPAAE